MPPVASAHPAAVAETLMIGVSLALVLLFGLLTLVSYVDRLYQEIGKFLSRDFQDNIDSFEQIVEPRLGVTRANAPRSPWPFSRNWSPRRLP